MFLFVINYIIIWLLEPYFKLQMSFNKSEPTVGWCFRTECFLNVWFAVEAPEFQASPGNWSLKVQNSWDWRKPAGLQIIIIFTSSVGYLWITFEAHHIFNWSECFQRTVSWPPLVSQNSIIYLIWWKNKTPPPPLCKDSEIQVQLHPLK